MNKHPVRLRGCQTFFLMEFHAILRQISNNSFFAISLRELSVCAIDFTIFFSNSGQTTVVDTSVAIVPSLSFLPYALLELEQCKVIISNVFADRNNS